MFGAGMECATATNLTYVVRANIEITDQIVLLPILTDINVVIELSGYSSEFARLLNLPSMVCLPFFV